MDEIKTLVVEVKWMVDYEDFLRHRKMHAWDKNDPEALAVRAVGKQLDQSDQTDKSDPVAHAKAYAPWLERADPAVVANTLICLIHQANYLLQQQITALERDFVQEGGYSEQLAAARLAERQKPHLTANATFFQQRPPTVLPPARSRSSLDEKIMPQR